MIRHCHEKIEKQPSPTLHLHLHCPTALKGVPTPDNQRKVVGTQLRLGVWRVLIGISRTGEDGTARDAGLEALFPEGELLQGFDTIFFGGAAVHHHYKPEINQHKIEKGLGLGRKRIGWTYYTAVSFKITQPAF